MTKRRNLRRRTLPKSSRSLHHETLERRELLAAEFGAGMDGPRLISVAANSGQQFDLDGNNRLTVAPSELTFRFDGAQPLDPATLSAIQFRGSGGDGSFDDGNETTIIPGFLGFADDSDSRIVVARFRETLPDDQYAIEVAGFDDTDPNSLVVGLRNVNGDLFCPPDPADEDRPVQTILMDVEVGPRVVAIVPQPIEGVGAARTPNPDKIDVYFNDDPLSNPNAGKITTATSSLPVVNPQFYKLLYTHDTVENTDDGLPFLPTSVEYDPVLNRARLTFASDLSSLPPALANNGAGTFRLRVGSGDPIPAPPTTIPAASDAGDLFSSAASLGTTFGVGTQSVVVTGGVIRAAKDVIPQWPGAYEAPGLRDYRRDAPIVGRVDTNTGINVYEYNFANLYGLDPQLNLLNNAITPAQQDRAREILGLFADRLGVEFVETENRGLQIVTGDIRALAVSADTGSDTPYSLYRVNDADPTRGVLVMDAGQNWYDDYGVSPDVRPSWFVEALRGIGSLLGIGNTFELPPGDASGGSSPSEPNSLLFTTPYPNLPVEPDFLTQGNVITGQALHRPESDDIDFYRFRATTDGRVTIETFAQRLEDSSNLDTHLKLYRVLDAAAGEYELVASNDDFFSDDSFIRLDLQLPRDSSGSAIPTDYIVGVSASGNDSYNGEVPGSGLGGLSEGAYDLRVTFDSQVGLTITDTNGSELDGDADGRAGGDFNFWFRVARDTATPAADEPRTIYVDKTDGDDFLNAGTLGAPLQTISAAFAASRPGDIVRLLPSGGVDGLINTTADNDPYEIGFGGSGNRQLPDGGEFEVPRGVTVMIDAGAILKLRTAKISVGSESVDEDRSLAALQILGTPEATVDADGNPVDGLGSVFFTSYDDPSLGVDNNTLNVPPQPGNWAGIEFRNDFDYAEGRAVWETEGIFLDYSSHANIRYGGGSISPTSPVVNALQMAEARPTLIHNVVTDNADAAISADPNSFLESNFHAPRFQRVASFTSDYNRVGPEIYGNTLERNTTNGLFVRVVTPAAGQLEPMTVSGRFDDREVVHVLSQVLVLQGQPGGSLLLEQRPDVLSVTFANATGGTLQANAFYDYRVTFVTSEGRESLASLSTAMKQAPAGRAITLNGLPVAPPEFAGRRIYRLNPSTSQYEFVAQLDRGTRSFTDDGTTRGGLLPAAANAASRLLPRFDARLSIDPGLIVKLENSRIETGFGSDFYAEGVDGDPVVFTSRLDDSFGAAGTFDTNNNAATASPGDWGGLVFRQDSIASLDYVRIQYAGGTTPIEGGFAEFNPVEILQADVRIAHSTIRDNADGFIGTSVRAGRGFNGPAAVFIRGSEPIIVDNTIVNNEGAAFSINPDALGYHDNLDHGRATGPVDIVATDQDNQGPLFFGNRLVRNDLNGLLVRSEILQGESVWDDTDVVHIVDGEIHSMTHHHRGGLRLKSDANQSLVVKFGPGGRLVGSGRPLDIDDRIGGTLQILGQGGFPVILTSLLDDTVGAGFTPEGVAQTDTDNAAGTPAPGDWAGIELLSYVNDRNVAYVIESERAIAAAINENAIADTAQVIGDLAAHEYAGDETERLGFNVRGTLANPDDQDVYRFTADGGTLVFIDIDDTSFGLDTVVDVIDVNDQVLASSDNSFAETTNPGLLVNNLDPGAVLPLYQSGLENVESPNSLDAGMRVILDGTGKDNTYYVRVRSANGQSSGQYRLSIRLREKEEIAGSTVQLADIRYATDAILVSGAPLHSPLAGDSTERLDYLPDGTPVDVDTTALTFTEANATHIGNLLTSDRGSLRVSGEIGNIRPTLAFEPSDEIDVYQVDLFAQQIEPDVFDSENRFVATTFEVDYADQLGRVNTSLAVYDAAGRLILHSRDSNVADDVGRPLQGDDPENLAGGSTGVLDAYIGPVELPEGTYYVAVSSAIAVPNALDQFFEENPTSTQVRLMPINSIRRFADDSMEGFQQYSADRPIIEPILDFNSIVPYSLDDIRLFVSFSGGISGNNNASLASFNPFNGVMDRLIGQSGQPTGDIAARRDGELFSYSLGPQTGPENNGNVGNFLNISPANGAATQAGDDGISFQRNNQAGDDLEADDNAQLDILAMAFPLTDGSSINNNAVNDNQTRFFLVGQRDNRGRGGEIPDIYARNIFYTATPASGQITSLGSTDANAHRQFNGTIPYFPFYGSTSPDVEWGFVDTGAIFGNGDGGDITGLAADPNDSVMMTAVTDLGGVHVFDYTSGTFGPGDFLTRSSRVIQTVYYGQLQPDPRDFASVSRGYVEFQGLAYGPRQIDGGEYRQTLFGVSSEGWLYAFTIDSSGLVPANVFYNGQSSIPLQFEGGFDIQFGAPDVNGLAFSNLENNPWHFTDDRRNDPDHGIFIPYDQSRTREIPFGGTSLYFGFEITNNEADNTVSRPDADPLGEISPGGTQGSVVTNSFDLSEYSEDDKPTLYFSYFLEVEDPDDYLPGVRLQRDSFRVFGSGDEGNWVLLATNNDFRDLQFADEYDGYDVTQIPVQQLFDDSNAWRQARVDISPFAGQEDVRIRFDFSTSGSMRHQFGSLELITVDGNEIEDRGRLELQNELGQPVLIENIVGKDVVIPPGSRLANGDGFTVDALGTSFTITFVTGTPTAPGEVRFSPTDSAQDLAVAVAAALPSAFSPVADGGGVISILAATNITVLGDSPIGQSNPTNVTVTADQLVVPAGSQLSSGDTVLIDGAGTSTRLVFVTAADATGDPDELIFAFTDTATQVASKIHARLPVELDAVLEPNARLSFINSPVTLTFIAPPPANETAPEQPTERRVEIVVPDGNSITDGSLLTIFNFGVPPTTIQFVRGVGPAGTGIVYYTPGESANTIAARLQAELFDSLLNQAGDGVLVLGTFVSTFQAPGFTASAVLSREAVFPDGATMVNGDKLTVNDANGIPLTVTFSLVPTAMAPIAPTPPAPPGSPNEGTVFYTLADTADTIASNVELALQNFFVTKVVGDRVLFFTATDLSTFDPMSAIVDPSQGRDVIQNRLELLMPSGTTLVNTGADGQQLTVRGVDGDFTLTFVLNTVPEGPGTIHFSAADTPNDLALRLQALLPPSLDPILNFAGDGLLLRADDAFGIFTIQDRPIGAESVTLPSGAVPLFNDSITFTDSTLPVPNLITINFQQVAAPTPPIPAVGMTPGTVFYQPTDTPDVIAANLALALGNFFVTVVTGDTVEVYDATDSTTTDPDSQIINDANLGQFVRLPFTGQGLIDGETIFIESPFGNVTVRFTATAFSANPTDVFYANGDNRATLHSRLQAVLPAGLRAIVTQTGTLGPVVQILGATDITVNDPMSQIVAGPNAYAREVLNLDIKNGNEIRNGEQLIVSGGGESVTFTFVRRGSISNAVGTTQIVYDDTTLASDLYQQILDAIPQEIQAFIDLGGDGINLGVPGANALVLSGVSEFMAGTLDIDEFAIPITVPNGTELTDGETITIFSKDDIAGVSPITITFRLGSPPPVPVPGEVYYVLTDSAADITLKLYDVLPLSLQAFIFSSDPLATQPREINLLNAASVITQPGSAIVSFQALPGAIPIQINSTMDKGEVAFQMTRTLAEGFGRLAAVNGINTASSEDYPIIAENRIRLYNAEVIDQGSYGISAYSTILNDVVGTPLAVFDTSTLPVEAFGLDRPSSFSSNQIDGVGGANNNIEGVYLDDVIIGFAERGEMVLNAPANNRGFALNPETTPDSRPEAVQPERQNETLTGAYSLEIRTSDEYGIPEDYDPVNLVLAEDLHLNGISAGRSFDTNDRLVDGAVTLMAQPGNSLIDGDTFVLSDGIRQMTFEFDSILDVGVSPGNVAVSFDPAGSHARDVATSIRNAINSAQSQDVLAITAATGDSRETGPSTSRLVELFTTSDLATIAVNPGGGRFIKMDLVDEETFQGRETSKQLPFVDHVNQTVFNATPGDAQARAAVSGYADGTVDVLVAVGKIGDQVNTGEGVDDDPIILADSPEDDRDYVRIYLQAGQSVDMDLDTRGFARGAEILDFGLLRVFNSSGVVEATSGFLSSAPGEIEAAAFLNFTATTDGYYDVEISGFGFDYGEYQLTIRPEATSSAAIPDRDVLMVDYHFGKGDVNRVQDQGQIIIASNFISDAAGFGVLATAGPRGQAFESNGNAVVPDDNPRPGSVNLLRNVNTDMLLPGPVISNNVLVNTGSAAIGFVGGTANNGQAPAPIQYGRILNNTAVGAGGLSPGGTPAGIGIQVIGNASPTLLNNLISGFDTGFDISGPSVSAGTVVGANAFQNNNTPSTIPLATTSVTISGEVFQDPQRRIFIPVDQSIVIDSSVATLPDRTDFFITVKDPVGISASPIIAPLFDAYGQPRFDDPLINPPGGSGEIVTIDRGAVDRADRTSLVAELTGPQDAIGTVVPLGDRDPDESFVRLATGTVEFFEIQLLDPAGTGPDKDTITPESVLLTENGRRLIPDVDFIFGYSDNSRTIRLTPLSGLWLPDAVYEITLNNQQRIQYEVPGGDQVSDGDQVILVDTAGSQSVFEFESGYSLLVPQTTLLTVTGTNADFNDRDLFSITSPGGNSLTFEIDFNASTAGGNVRVDLSDASTIVEVRDAILASFDGLVPGNPQVTIKEFLDIEPVAVGRTQIQLGTLAGHTIPTSIPGLDVTGQAGGIEDGQTFTYTADVTRVSITFEFDDDSTQNDSSTQLITFSRQDTPGQIAQAIATAVQQQTLGLGSAIASDDGTVVLGGQVGDTLVADQSALIPMGAPGVTGPLTLTIPPAETGASIDGSTFSIDVDGIAITFRYTTDPSLTSPDRLILLDPTDLVDDIAAKTAAEIALAYPDELSPFALADAVTLGEPPAIPPAGQPASLTMVDGGTAGLIVGGVSGGAIPVSYLPTSPRTSLAATLQSAIDASPLLVETFSPGGGTILISDAESLSVATVGNPPNVAGVLTPAVADLAGNPVRETRVNNETRFTIIMPDVVFDLGDAAPPLPTLFVDNGARHTVDSTQLPRLGDFIDTESDGQPVNQDDNALDVDLVQTPAIGGMFTIDSISIPNGDRIVLNRLPLGGETLEVTVGLQVRTFELVEITSNPTGSNIPVVFSNTDTLEEITAKLVSSLRGAIPQTDDGLFIEQESPTSILITSVDDEDGVSQGVFSDGTANYNVFTLPGTDPNNIRPEDVLGFLNPEDPAGTNIAVNVRGSGLLHAWVDFDRSGAFEPDEQVLTNVPVSGDPDTGTFNFVTVFTPSDAVDGMTWMRFRISEAGNLRPTGVAVGGEVEDYPVQIISVPLPDPGDDQYTISEDTTLDTLADGLDSLGVNDTIPGQPPRFLPVQYIAGRLPVNGRLVSLDSTSGHFVYEPDPDFYGVDTFTYRLSTQQNASANVVTLDSFATVTITVGAINDMPGATDKTFLAQEDLPLTITADDLLVGATPDEDPQYTAPGTDPLELQNEALINELNQLNSLAISAVQGSGPVAITASNAAAGADNLLVTSNGLGLNIRVTNATEGDLVTLSFAGTTRTFQLVAEGDSPQAGTIPIQLLAGDTPPAIASRLVAAIDGQFNATEPVVLTGQSGDTVSMGITPLTLSGSATGNFAITPGAGTLTIDVTGPPNPTQPPTGAMPNPPVGDTVSITVGSRAPITFELLEEGAFAASGNIGITVLPFQDPASQAARASVAAQFAAAIQSELSAAGVGVISAVADGASNPFRINLAPATITAGKPFDTARGSAIAVFDSFGSLIEMRYISSLDLNRDNPPPAMPLHTDEFTFTVRDNGVSIDLINNSYVYGTPEDSDPATALIDVAPQNDPPLLSPDHVTVGPLGPDEATVLTDWEIFGGETPTEDVTLNIDPAFLLANDLRGPATAADENVAGSLNDTGLTVTAVSMVDPTQGSVQLLGGTIVFTPAADIFGDVLFNYSARDQGVSETLTGLRPVFPLTSTDGVVTVTIQPVNDVPVAMDRALTYTESADPGPGDAFVFTRDDLINGSATESPNAPGNFPPTLAAPFNESEQTLRVVRFSTAAGSIDATSLSGSGLETLTLDSDAGGLFEFDFVDGIFTEGRLTTTDDYNRRSPFAPTETFTYEISDDGLTTSPQSGGQFNLPDARSDDDPAAAPGTVTITVLETNDAPTFDIDAPLVGGVPTLDILERDDNLGTVVDDFAINVLPGPPTALDETDLQDVVFTFPPALNPSSNVPPGLFTQLPELTPQGQLTVFPAPDAIGTATLVVQAEDVEPGTIGFSPRQTLKTFVINVQPVNDPPRFDPTVAGTSDSADPDEAYSVAANDFDNDGRIDNAAITYVLREDNTQAQGVTEPYFIPLNAAPSVGYSRIGLLDVFTVGPDNEAGPLPGGSQVIEFLRAGNDPVAPNLDRTTDRGGILTPVFDINDTLIGLNYVPPLDFNVSFAGVDSFTYTVRDDSLSGGETYSLAAGALVPDRLTSTNTVELVLNPVNDRPEFTVETLNLSVREDGSEVSFISYASNISAGPPNTAFDEVDVITGQLVEFTVTSLDFPREDADDFFSIYPSIDEQSGLLNFQTAPDVFGDFRFELVLTDRNRDGTTSDNTLRGDLISSIPITLTISVQPINDPPEVDPGAAPLAFQLLEDGTFDILVTGDNTNPGLLDPFLPGPSSGATDESANVSPGGNQTVSLGTPIPTTSAQGGTIEFVTSGGTPRLQYTPRANFVGMDSFIYTVTDDGTTVGVDGVEFSDPRIASNTVTFEVLPVNDAPLFSGAGNVQSSEDAGLITVPNWATNVQAGPTTAVDEIDGRGQIPPQALQFVFTQTSSNPNLFLTPPSAVIDPVTGTAALTYQTNPDASGVATFSVVLEDFGPRDASIGDEFVSSPPRVFSITVTPVNDPPSFDLANDLITRPEDGGPFNVLQAINISPGPEDEQSQTVVFEIEPLPPEFASLFSEPPTINSDGLLRFTTAPNQNTDNVNGPAVIRVIGRDSDGAETAAAEFRIAVTEVNDPPRAFSDEIDTDEDTVLVISEDSLKANDVDPDLQTNASEVVRVVMPPQSFSVNGALVTYDSNTGQITYDPTDADALQSLPPGSSLVDSFAYSLIDAAGAASNLVTVALDVSGINDAPRLLPDEERLDPDNPTIIRVLDNDTDVDGTVIPSTVRVGLQPAFGSATVQPDGTIIYNPFATFTTEDSFTYSVEDNLRLRSEQVVVTISSNLRPVAVGDARGTFLDEPIVINVAANDSDPDGTLDLTSIVIVSQPQRGQAIPLSDGSVRYLPDTGFLGRDSFQYQIADNQGRLSNVATVNTQVVASRLQNPDDFADVNDDGDVTALDALLVINHVARADGATSIPVLPTDRGPNFYDVSGNQLITANDALRVINQLSRESNIGIDFEQTPLAPLAKSTDRDESDPLRVAPPESLEPAVPLPTVDASPVSSVMSDDVLDLIATERETETDEKSVVDAVDAAMADLL